MIFLSLGTHEQPFPRAIDLVAGLAGSEELVIQHGHTPARETELPDVRWHEYLAYEEMVRLLEDSRAFLCHAGVGSVLTALQRGITPIVIPRERRFGEHVDDHQLQLTTQLAARQLVVVVGAGGLSQAIAEAEALRGRERGPGPQLRAAVAKATDRRGGLFEGRADRRSRQERRRQTATALGIPDRRRRQRRSRADRRDGR